MVLSLRQRKSPSLPVRGEGIEMAQHGHGGGSRVSPIREERIEMNPIMLKPVIVRSLSIQGK